MLSDLPDELKVLIVDHLERFQDLNSLCKTSKGFYAPINQYMYARDVQQTNGLCLLWASRHGQVQTAQMSLSAGASLRLDELSTRPPNTSSDRRVEDRWIPLHFAANDGNYEMTKFLLDSGTDVNCVTRVGDTPLLVCNIFSLDVVELLLARDADIHATNDEEEGILHIAIFWGYPPLVKYFLDRLGPLQVIDARLMTCACRYSRLEIAELLFEHNLPIRHPEGSFRGAEPLSAAVLGGNRELIKWLLSKGALSNTTMDDSTYLGLLQDADHHGFVALLKQYGYDVNRQRNSGKTILHLATRQGKVDQVKLLLRHGADFRLRDNRGQSPLDVACSRNSMSVARVLIQQGASWLEKGNRAMCIACVNRHSSLVRILLDESLRVAKDDAAVLVLKNAMISLIRACQDEQVKAELINFLYLAK